MFRSIQLWRDARGRLSMLRIATLAILLWPIVLAVIAWWTTDVNLDAHPFNDLIHRAGFWAFMFLLMSLAVTPLRRVLRYGALVDVRRMIGVGAFCYATAHILLYAADQMFDLSRVGSEIAMRLYLTIGFTALVGLAALAATSTDGMVYRLGAVRWRRLQQLTYLIFLFALVHFFQQTKLDVTVPTLVAGLFTWLIGYRLAAWWWTASRELPTWLLLALTVVAAGLTFAGESIGIGLAFAVSPLVVLGTAFDFDLDNLGAMRPGWLVLAVGLCVVAFDAMRSRWPRQRPGRL